MALFRKLIKCKHCGGNFKFRKNRNKGVYICSRVDNYGDCVRVTIEESFLRGLIERRYNKKMTDDEIISVVDHIEVEDSLLLEIHFNDNSIPILLKGNFVQF